MTSALLDVAGEALPLAAVAALCWLIPKWIRWEQR